MFLYFLLFGVKGPFFIKSYQLQSQEEQVKESDKNGPKDKYSSKKSIGIRSCFTIQKETRPKGFFGMI